MSWELKSDRPIYAQIIEKVQVLICTGTYPAGSRMPSVRELAQEATVNPNTMQKALSQLEEMGLIVTYRTSGRSVTEDTTLIQTVKDNLAKNGVAFFMDTMQELGYKKEETLTLVTEQIQQKEWII